MSTGICNCDNRYFGEQCECNFFLKYLKNETGEISIFSSSDIFCLNNCSGNGECNQETGICNCGESYSGSDCSCNYKIIYLCFMYFDKKII